MKLHLTSLFLSHDQVQDLAQLILDPTATLQNHLEARQVLIQLVGQNAIMNSYASPEIKAVIANEYTAFNRDRRLPKARRVQSGGQHTIH